MMRRSDRSAWGRARTGMRAALLGATLVLAGCASAPEPSSTGFLLDTEELVPVEGGLALVYRRPGFSFGDYDAVLLDPVQIFCASSSSFEDVDPLELKRLARSFENAIQRKLEDRYKFVDSIGPRVMRLRLAITDVDISKRPILDAVDTLSKDVSFRMANVSMEGEILDSRSDERLAAFVDRRRSDQTEGLSAFDFWAGRLRERMDEER